ncbi:PREDICTED: dnaJ protein ERDJ2A-like [Brassica oleracea var. oleracea]|uniref:dnaJ protein ERDJ2A-like n=1 Tax=Brassica oleracea var. oleracea TaxID=109376 RepID=UPI0006A6C235|nr:PREDICTED: dnaJ protein ERDJ2A-like [Brassica oleracea var. oleracea]
MAIPVKGPFRCQCLECDSSGKYKRSLFKKISNFSTWSNLTLVLLWVVIIFLIYYTKNLSRQVHICPERCHYTID